MADRTRVMRKRLMVAIGVGGALLMLGCGKTRDVSDGAPSATAGDSGAPGCDRGAPGCESGAMGGDGGALSADGGATTGDGGSSTGDAGSGHGGHAWGGAATWDPQQCHAAPVPKPADPTAAEEWSLARDYCAVLGKQGCLGAAVLQAGDCSGDAAVEACVAEVLWFHSNGVSPECESAWRNDVECGANSSFVLPACGGVVAFGPYGPSDTCVKENAALSDCARQHSTDVAVAGSYTTCDYSTAPLAGSGCAVTCPLGPNTAELDCSGAEGLPKQCGCKINGHVIFGPNPIFVNDCADAAQQAADGLCTGKLDCCFSYMEQGKPECRCEEPGDFGYESCDAMMAVAQGRRVDICPTLLPDDSEGVCWPPGSCSP